MSWDWSTATTQLENGQAISIYNADGEQIYFTDKGTFTWQKDAIPDYAWFNGTANHHLLTDSITDIPVRINTLYGDYHDPDSKIIPMKVHRGKQPYDLVHNRILQAKLWDPEKGKGGLWVDYDWDAALKAGMDYLDLPFSGQYGFVETIFNNNEPPEGLTTFDEISKYRFRKKAAAIFQDEDMAGMALPTPAQKKQVPVPATTVVSAGGC
ncbi:MAG: hypothetical protein K0B37_08000 [Bacteroidales bacterium]|nr:hypothetical protein [Bacteroidales bacterium]